MLQCGVAKRKVTPPTWVPYLTSAGNGTCAPFGSVHDELYARALVLNDGDHAVGVLSVDAIGYDNAVAGPGENFTAEVRSRVAATTGLPRGAVMVSATHAHSTPETIGLTPFRETPGVQNWLAGHLDDLVVTMQEAWSCQRPAKAFYGTSCVQGIARYRRILLEDGTLSRRGPVPNAGKVAAPGQTDEQLSVLYLEDVAGSPIGVLMNFTAHPVVTMLLPPVSADYPGAAARGVEAALEGSICLFTNGAAGNVNSVHVTTDYADAAELGNRLSAVSLDVVEQLRSGAPLDDTTVRCRSTDTRLEGRACPPLAEAEDAAARDPSGRAQRVCRLARKLAEGPVRAEVQLMGVGACRWIGLPGEAFVETGFALKRAGASFVVGYANGWVGYLPVRQAYEAGGYEVEVGPWSRVAQGSAERLEAEGRRLLREFSAAG